MHAARSAVWDGARCEGATCAAPPAAEVVPIKVLQSDSRQIATDIHNLCMTAADHCTHGHSLCPPACTYNPPTFTHPCFAAPLAPIRCCGRLNDHCYGAFRRNIGTVLILRQFMPVRHSTE